MGRAGLLRVSCAVQTRALDLILAGEWGEAVPSEESWRHSFSSGFVLVCEGKTEETETLDESFHCHTDPSVWVYCWLF